MFEKIELFSGILKFSIFWAIVDVVVIVHFLVSWILSARKTKWKIDFWYFHLFLFFFVVVFLMYPFNASILNIRSFTLGRYTLIEEKVDLAFAISLLGYAFVWVGRYVHDLFGRRLLLSKVFGAAGMFSSIIEKNIKRASSVWILFGFVVFLWLLQLSIQIKEGLLLHTRDFYQAHGELRPLYNLTTSLLSVSILYCGLRSIQYRDKYCRWMVVFLVFLSLFLGARGAFIWPLVFLSAYSCFMKKGKVSFLRYGAVIVSILWLALYANKIRQQQYNPLAILGSFLLDLFYGNHLSDTRDFAWVLAYWDGEFLFGKTFLSGLISFIPRFLSEFRDQWAIGVYTASVAGYDPSTHYGLRPGLFGESYFNFGYVGVSTMGFFLGYTLRYADVKIKEAIETSRDIIAGYSHAIFFTFVATMAVSAGVWAFYLFVIINVLLLFVPFTSYRRISSLRYKNENSACS